MEIEVSASMRSVEPGELAVVAAEAAGAAAPAASPPQASSAAPARAVIRYRAGRR